MSNKQFHAAFELAQEKVRALITNHPGYYPMYTVNGKWKHAGETWTHWCDGFLPGQMWIFYEKTRSPFWLEKAIEYSKPLEPRQFDRNVHDLGFIFCSTYLRWLKVLKRQKSTDDDLIRHIEDVLIQAGRTMSLRFNEKGRYLRSFLAPDSLFIDIMMNVGIIFYAAKILRQRGLRDDAWDLSQTANAHCETTLKCLVRGDGSTAHEAIFDLNTGECLHQSTQQGYRRDSCWARGLAWAAYGFLTAYRLNAFEHWHFESHYLLTSERCVRYFVGNSPMDRAAPWDFDAWDAEDSKENPTYQEDSSASAIMASALHSLSRLAKTRMRRRRYRRAFHHVMNILIGEKYLGREREWEGILKHGVYHIHKGLGVDESVMWGEYFFVEALSKLV